MAVAVGPVHGPATKPDVTESNIAAVEFSSADSSSHAAAAVSMEPDPGPVYIRPELISGGKTP